MKMLSLTHRKLIQIHGIRLDSRFYYPIFIFKGGRKMANVGNCGVEETRKYFLLRNRNKKLEDMGTRGQRGCSC